MSDFVSLNSGVNSNSNVVSAPKTSTDKVSAPDSQKDRKVLEATKKFEAYFISQLLKNMRKTVPKNGLLDGGFGKDIYYSMLDNALADQMSEAGGIGLSDVLARQFGVEQNKVFDPEVADVSSPIAMQAIEAVKNGIGENKEHPASPIKCKWLGSRFGVRFSVRRHAWKFHRGIDLNAPIGTPIKAVLSGVVKVAGEVQGYGNVVYIDHGNGMVTRYGHASKLLVKPGEHVKQGQVIALVGQTGRADGPHLHFEVRVNGAAIDPEPWLGEEVMNETAPNYIHLKKH